MTNPIRTPYCHKVRYGVTGTPTLDESEMDGSHAPGIGMRPKLIELVYSAPRDGKPGSVTASVTGEWTRFGKPADGEVTAHFGGSSDGWPAWLAEEARLHDPGAPAVPSVGGAALRDRIRRAICEAEGFTWDSSMLEPDEYGDVADMVLAVLPAPADRAAVPAPSEPFPIWTVWREERPAYGSFATEDIAKQASIDCWEEDEPVCPDYSWRPDGGPGNWELLVGDERAGVYIRRHLVWGGLPQPPRAAVLTEAADWFDGHSFTRFFGHQVATELRRLAGGAAGSSSPEFPDPKFKETAGNLNSAGEAAPDNTETPQPNPVLAYGGKGRVWCVKCPRPTGEDVPFAAGAVDPWELCPSCGRHVVDVAEAEGAAPPRDPHPTEADVAAALAILDRFHGRGGTTPEEESRG